MQPTSFVSAARTGQLEDHPTGLESRRRLLPATLALGWLALSSLAGAGCATATVSRAAELRTSAVDDLRCPHDELRVEEIDFKTAGVEGCGQRATYAWNDQYATWLLQERGRAEQRSAQLAR